MEIKLFSLCNQDSPSADEGKKIIYDCACSFFPECEDFSHFTSQKRVLVAVSQSLLAADIVLIAVQSSMYNTTKKMLSDALGIKTEKNNFVEVGLKKNPVSSKMKPNVFTSNITFPIGAEILETENFINCGFALTSGGQHIIYMPIDSPKAHDIVFGSLYDYLAPLSDNPGNGMKHRHKALVNCIEKKFAENSVKVAIAPTSSSDYIKNFIKKSRSSVFVFDEEIVERQTSDVRDHMICVAQKAMENHHTQLGAAISNLYVSNEKTFVYLVLTDFNGTKIAKLSIEDSESSEDFISACIDKFLLMILKYDESEADTDYSGNKKADKKLEGILGIAASSVVLAASVAGFILALVLK